MRKTLFLLFIIITSSGKIFSQTDKDSTREYIELWVNYRVVTEGITAKLFIDIGTSKNHSLYGLVKNGDADNIIFYEENITKVFNNEVDLLNYLSDTGWEIYDVQVINLLAKDYIKYILYRMK